MTKKKKGKKDLNFDFAYNSGIALFDVFYKMDKDPKKINANLLKGGKKHPYRYAKKYFEGFDQLTKDVKEKNWEEIKNSRETNERREKLENFKDTVFADAFLTFIDYMLLKVIEDKEKTVEYREKTNEIMKKYLPKKLHDYIEDDLEAHTKKVLQGEIPEETAEKQLEKYLKSLKK